MSAQFTFLLFFVLFLLCSIWIQFNFQQKQIKCIQFLFFGMTGFLITFYVRYIVYDHGIWATDEGNYIYIMNTLESKPNWPISGPFYVLGIEYLQRLCGMRFLRLVPLVAAVLSTLIPIMMFFWYDLNRKENHSFLSCLMLLSSSYFIWPMIEGRPQQFGMVLLCFSAYFFFQYIQHKRKRDLFFFWGGTLLIFCYHIFTFIILTALLMISWYWHYIRGKTGLISIFAFLAPLAVCAYLYMNHHFFYFYMFRDIFRNHLVGMRLFFPLLGVIILIPMVFLLKQPRYRLVCYMAEKVTNGKILFALMIVGTLGLLFQYLLIRDQILHFYNGSLLTFLGFQVGNIIFFGLYIGGIHILSRSLKEDHFFLEYSVIMALIGGLLLLLSICLLHKNWALRTINYWTMFAAPIAALPLLRLMETKRKTYVPFFLSGVITISLILSSKDPSIFNFGRIWNNQDVAAIHWLCHQEGEYVITHTRNSFQKLSKEESYPNLIKIICGEQHPVVNTSQESCDNVVYKKGFIEVCRD